MRFRVRAAGAVVGRDVRALDVNRLHGPAQRQFALRLGDIAQGAQNFLLAIGDDRGEKPGYAFAQQYLNCILNGAERSLRVAKVYAGVAIDLDINEARSQIRGV